jgi:5-methylcytosine-specific restriction protein A
MPTRPKQHNSRLARPVSPDKPKPRVHEARGSAHSRGYGRKWREARLGYLQRHPLCVHCLSKGHVTAATDVDHIKPHRGDLTLFWDAENNWQALCHSCHSKKTASEDSGFGNARKQY